MNFLAKEWNEGEDRMHDLLHVPEQVNPTQPGLSAHAQRLLHLSTLVALGTVDREGRPWTTLLGGEEGFARSLGQSIVGIKAVTDIEHDPVLRSILQATKARSPGTGSPDAEYQDFSALGLHLATRNRVKLQGKLVGAGVVGPSDDVGEVQIALAISGSLGNCPKYLNAKDMILTVPKPVLASDRLPLSEAALSLLAEADTFFITSSHPGSMSTNHRGGPKGLIRVLQNDEQGCVLVYPEYSGNRLYQTLGNLVLNPRAGIAIPDFATGTILHLTCTTNILYGAAASATLPGSSLAVELHLTAARLIENGLGFRSQGPGDPSPYNPPVRYLPSERPPRSQHQQHQQQQQEESDLKTTATLLSRSTLTPTISRLRFRLSAPRAWSAGQSVALGFDSELSGGYAHMNDEDPRSLNDDFVRTFTVSSPPPGAAQRSHQKASEAEAATAPSTPVQAAQAQEFEITIRNVGKATAFLLGVNPRSGLELPVLGFAGEFVIKQAAATAGGEAVPFVAGGVGITPLLAQARDLDLRRVKLFWSVRAEDVALVVDTFEGVPELRGRAEVFVTGGDGNEEWESGVEGLVARGVSVKRRRMEREDVKRVEDELGKTWYICAGLALRKSLLEWLGGDKEVIYENFDY